MAESLSGLMREAQKKNLYDAFEVGSDKVEVSILQYVDDTIFLGDASMANVAAIKAILWSFELVSGLKINFSKSCFGAFGVSEEWVKIAANMLNFRLLLLPFSYLGIPIGAIPRQSETWDH